MSVKCVKGRVIVRVEMQQKNGHTFKDGTEIIIQREYDNLDRGYTQQVLGEVVDSEYIPKGALILFHFNALHAINEVFNHASLSGDDIASGVKIFSIKEDECFLWKEKGESDWMPLKNFVIAERVFEPYKGAIQGIPPKQVKDVLYIKTGELAGLAVHTLKACDYCIIFRNEKGVEERIIRCRHFEGDELNEREEIVAVSHEITEKINNGEYLIGLSPSDAKPLEITAYAD